MVDTQTLFTRADLLATNYPSNPGTGAIGSQQFRSHVVSEMGCYAHLDTNAASGVISQNLTADNGAGWAILKGSGWANTAVSSDLEPDRTAGTITLPASGASGVYLVWYQLQVLTGSETGLLEASVFVGSTQKTAGYSSVDVLSSGKRFPFGSMALISLSNSDVVSIKVQWFHATTSGTSFLGAWGMKRIG